MASQESAPTEVPPPSGSKKYWTRRGIAEWLVQHLGEGEPTLVGIDHGFSFPLKYFERHALPRDWSVFLNDFHRHWPTDDENTYVEFIRDVRAGNGAARAGDAKWRRVTEVRAGAAKSVFQFDVPGSVAKSTHAGLPWLRYIRQRLPGRVFFWTFDGWTPPAGRSVIAGSPRATARPTSTTPGPLPSGCAERTSMAVLLSSSRQTSQKLTWLPLRSRAGSWDFGEPGALRLFANLWPPGEFRSNWGIPAVRPFCASR